ncbi:hypothetical protein BOTBODRAFT_253703 [Botryobasidium botryosum FD-172 SS1]|uniref:Uncharacterized protein n=1 Tax=Botryobasidium botryosum (strain FD-172 SS1) TaxID=930990 RepID=A0A067LT14_BOTB1|nr:hypothetical protein BOTBODRAFT_253703 [Botryobasidium botryosum FD-172 SS1]
MRYEIWLSVSPMLRAHHLSGLRPQRSAAAHHAASARLVCIAACDYFRRRGQMAYVTTLTGLTGAPTGRHPTRALHSSLRDSQHLHPVCYHAHPYTYRVYPTCVLPPIAATLSEAPRRQIVR